MEEQLSPKLQLGWLWLKVCSAQVGISVSDIMLKLKAAVTVKILPFQLPTLTRPTLYS